MLIKSSRSRGDTDTGECCCPVCGDVGDARLVPANASVCAAIFSALKVAIETDPACCAEGCSGCVGEFDDGVPAPVVCGDPHAECTSEAAAEATGGNGGTGGVSFSLETIRTNAGAIALVVGIC